MRVEYARPASQGVTTAMAIGEDPSTFQYKESAWWRYVKLAGGGVAGMHSYKRNRGNLAWTLVWTVLGYGFPVITTAVVLYQGYGKPKR